MTIKDRINDKINDWYERLDQLDLKFKLPIFICLGIISVIFVVGLPFACGQIFRLDNTDVKYTFKNDIIYWFGGILAIITLVYVIGFSMIVLHLLRKMFVYFYRKCCLGGQSSETNQLISDNV